MSHEEAARKAVEMLSFITGFKILLVFLMAVFTIFTVASVGKLLDACAIAEVVGAHPKENKREKVIRALGCVFVALALVSLTFGSAYYVQCYIYPSVASRNLYETLSDTVSSTDAIEVETVAEIKNLENSLKDFNPSMNKIPDNIRSFVPTLEEMASLKEEAFSKMDMG